MCCDLHTHSIYSDGTMTPTEIIKSAKKLGIAVALSDHNTLSGLPEFVSAAEAMNVEAVPGVEFSTDHEGRELHILGLFVRPEHYPAISEITDSFSISKAKSNLDLIDKLCRAGYNVDLRKIAAATPNGHVNRVHIAAELTALGYTSSITEAFDTLLSPEMGFYRPPLRISSFKLISFLKSIGVVSVLAHPFVSMTQTELEKFLPEAKKHGLDGMEVLYSEYDAKTEQKAMLLAKRYRLLMSGGSDFHGANRHGISLGTGRGNLRVPYELYQKLKMRAEENGSV